MKTLFLRSILCSGLGLAISLPASATQQAKGLNTNPNAAINTIPHGVLSQSLGGFNGLGVNCSLIDFEGMGDQTVIGLVSGDIDVTFGPSWLSLLDSDVGGSGNFANEPSDDTVAYFQSGADPIDFSQPVQFVQMSYVAAAISIPITLTAWDGPSGTGNIVDTASGSTVGTSSDGAPCVGDPGGTFCLWDSISLTAPTDSIRSLTLTGAVADQFAFDDMSFCTGDPIEAYCFGVACPCGNDDANAGCANASGTGALLSATGTPSVLSDDLVLTASNVTANQFGVIYGGGDSACIPFGDGFRAVTPGPIGSTVRFGVQLSSASGEMTQGPGTIGDILSLSGMAVSAGETWYFQAFYRDPVGPCSSAFNLSNGLAVTFGL
ncbi:MAG: hypothetical protein ACI835_000643 [Planctomycetota bacterium]|jgi:hypothetical protein